MATSTQTRLDGEYHVRDYALGDLLDDRAAGRSQKLVLTECPLCTTDPTRPRHYFGADADRAGHFERAHDASEI